MDKKAPVRGYAAPVGLIEGATASVEKQPHSLSAHGKSERAAGPLRIHVPVLVFGDVGEGEVPGARPAGDAADEVADLRRDLTGCTDGESGRAPGAVQIYLCLVRPGCVYVRAVLCARQAEAPNR